MTETRKPAKRLFVDAPLEGASLRLDPSQAHYVGRVLRCRKGERIVVFNARGTERTAVIESLAKRHSVLALDETLEPLPEPPVRIILMQALVKSDAMDLIVQKATELGVDTLLAVRTDFSVVRLDASRRESRLAHWRRIATNACEQSGRHRPPAIALRDDLDAAIAGLPAGCERLAFAVDAVMRVEPPTPNETPVCAAIGPEGGFSPAEAGQLARAGFTLHSLGPRTLRAETAAIAACAGLQLLGGDSA